MFNIKQYRRELAKLEKKLTALQPAAQELELADSLRRLRTALDEHITDVIAL